MADVVEHGRGRDRPARRWPWRLAAGLALLALVLGVADTVLRARTTDALVSASRAGQEAGTYADRRVAGTVQYAGTALTASSVREEVRADLRRLVGSEAAGQVPALRRARARLAAVRALPWHGDLRAARAAGVAHLDARVAHLSAVAADVRTLYAPRTDVDRTRRSAAAALDRVAPGRAVYR